MFIIMRHDIHHNDTQHKDNEHNGLICDTQHKWHSAQCIERHFAECRDNLNVMLSVVMLNVVMLSVIMLSVVMLSVIMLSVILLSVFMLSVIMLCVAAPIFQSLQLNKWNL